MALIRRQDPFWRPFREMEERMAGLLGRPWWSSQGAERETLATTDWAPSCDISETEDEYRISAELPNIEKDDVHVMLENGILTISGERREEKEEKDVKYHRRELSYGSFMRQFTMPEDADETKVDASFKDGLLKVTITKSKEKEKAAKEIAVH